MHLSPRQQSYHLLLHSPVLSYPKHGYTALLLHHCCQLHLACSLAESFYFVFKAVIKSQMVPGKRHYLYIHFCLPVINKRQDFYFTFSTTSTSLHLFVLLRGRDSIIFTTSPMLHSFFSS